jgi:hypothetical protein
VNSYKAPVRWFKGDEEIAEDGVKYIVEKPSILGLCKLTISNASLTDTGVYKCKIDNTKHVTKCSITFKGSPQIMRDDAWT